jgi:formylglycine-generating enzyme required for sulfatase activity
VIVGDPGGGKSTYLRRLAYEQSGPDATQFPILIRIFALEEFIYKRVHGGLPDTPEADSADWIPRYLANRAVEFQWGLDADFFRVKLRERSTLILLDGLDEVPNAARREAIARLFERATRAYRDARFVVTTRPAAYEGKATLDEFETVRIGELDAEAVEGFLEHWSGFLFSDDQAGARRHNEDLLDALRARPEIRRMARNPSMLTALAVIQWNERRLPEQRADLYESILKWLSEAHDYPNRPQGQKCLAIFGALALGMQCYAGGRVKQIEKAEAAKLIKQEFREAPAEHRESAALEFLESELVHSGIVVSRGSRLEFWHLTFQEYLAARACADFDVPAAVLFQDDRWSQQEWREVMLLVPGVLIRNGQKRVDAIFNATLDRAEDAGCSLAIKARAAGLLGAAVQDLRPSKYRPPNEARYHALLSEILGIFDAKRAAGIDLKVRVEAAEALGQAGDPRLTEDNWVKIPGGTFLMGAQRTLKAGPGFDPEAHEDEGPVREVSLAPFQIGRYPVTVEEYRRFVEDEESGYRRERCWVNGGYRARLSPEEWDEQILHPNRPVVSVNWFEAAAYCEWAHLRLPTEEEWEFAARGTEARKYPWGNQPPDASRAHYDEAKIGAATPVGLLPKGNTPEGVADMAGNVWEWTGSDYDKNLKVVRGASFCYEARWWLHAAYRGRFQPGLRGRDIGFRCVRE